MNKIKNKALFSNFVVLDHVDVVVLVLKVPIVYIDEYVRSSDWADFI